MMRKIVLSSLLLALLGGCMVGPDYQGPPDVAPDAVSAPAFHRADNAAATAPQPRWWRALSDAELDRLIEAACAASPDIDIAVARLRQSRAGVNQARANLLPSTGTDAAYLRTKGLTSALGGAQAAKSPGANDAIQFYDVGFDASWEVDLFGGKRRAAEGARAQMAAAQARLQDAQVSLAAEVAQAYVSLRDLQQRLILSEQNAAYESRMLDLTRSRRAGGAATDLDIERLYTQLQSTRADATPLKAQITEQLDRLAVLTGRAPGELDGELATAAPVPLPPAELAVGDPAALLRRRPDIRAAEQALAQKTALIGQRTADFFPKLELLGTIGLGSTDPSQLFNAGSFTYAVAPVLQWRPFDFGRTRATINEAEGERDEAIATYRKTVLGALQDAETALSRYGRQRETVVNLTGVKDSADRAAHLTALRVQGGTATTIDQLNIEHERVEAEARLTQGKSQLTQDYVALQKSLGLGWLP